MRLQAIFLSCWLLFTAAAVADEQLPNLDTVFGLQVEVINAHTLRLHWQMAADYFLFRDKIQVQTDSPGITLGELSLPAAAILTDSFFGDSPIYREALRIDLPVQRSAEAGETLKLSVFFQGCLRMDACYPRHEQVFNLKLPALTAVSTTAPSVAAPQTATKPAANPLPNSGEDFLDPDMAFLFDATLEGNEAVRVTWNIAEGYYLYRDKLHFAVENQADALGSPELPASESKQDEFFGQVEIYRHTLSVRLPLQNTAPLEHLILNVDYQGCAAAGLCYPPQRKSKTLTLGQSTASSAGSALAALGQSNRASSALGNGGDFLEPEQAFRFAADFDAQGQLRAHWEIADGYYLYRKKFKFTLQAGGVLSEAILPTGKPHQDEFFGTTEVYYQQVTAQLPLQRAAGATELLLEVSYQGCAEGALCYPPQTSTVTLPLPATIPAATASTPASVTTTPPLSEQDSIANTLKEGSVWWILLSFFGFGLLLSLTPCVFPMIPILSGIIVGQGKALTTRKAFTMSLVYVLAMALTYTVAGVIAGLLGENVQALFQNAWILGSFAGVFVLLSLSMFGFYELQMPASIQSKLTEFSNRQEGGTLLGVAIMGFLSALIVGPCVAAPLAGALIYIGQTGDAVLGGLALFSLSLGMGIPLVILGTSAGKLMPRAGGWMEVVKYVFGILLLTVAVWMLERILPAPLILLLYGLLLIVPAVYMGALEQLPVGVTGWRKFWKGVGLALLVYGILLLVGAAAGSHSPLQPLQGLKASNASKTAEPAAHASLPFKRIKNLADLEREVASAKAAGQVVMLDFYADWCVSCKEMEAYTFADARVQQALAHTVLLQSDVTANNADDKALLKHFGLFGPPAILFFDRQGQEQRAYRIVGFKPAADFLAHLQQFL